MIRKIFAVVFGLLLLAVVARAETSGEIALAAYPGYAIVASASGNGFDAFALENGDKTALCIVEDGKLTIANEHAFEAVQYVVLRVDTDHDELYLSWTNETGARTTILTAKIQKGVWNDVRVALDQYIEEQQIDGMPPVFQISSVWVQDGVYSIQTELVDENGDLWPGSTTTRIPVSGNFELSLGSVDIDKLPLTPEMCARTAKQLPDGFVAPLLNEGEVLAEMGAYPDRLLLLVQKADGSKCVRVCEWEEDTGYHSQDSVALGSTVILDILHASENQIFLEEKDRKYFFRKTRQGRWLFTGSMGEELLNVGVDCVRLDESGGVARNDGYVYGRSEPLDLMKVPVEEWPTCQEEAVVRLDVDAYALVNNDNPADRLHLREAPSRNAKSLGKFYNRTPVQILSWDGDWAHVRIGAGGVYLEGYMMTRYLVRGGGRNVLCAFEMLMPLEDLKDGAPIFLGPDDTTEEIGRFGQNSNEYIIGVCGDDWVIVMTWDGNVGYVRRADLWEGNG